MKKGKSKYVCMKKLIVHATTAKKKSDQKIYAFMARMFVNDECPNEKFGDSSQLTNWILDYGATCHMIPDVSYFVPDSLEDMDKHIEIAD